MQVLRYPGGHGASSHASAHRRSDGCRHFARTLRSRPPGDRQQAAESAGRHELQGDDAEVETRHAEIDLLAALPHSSRSWLDRERTPGRGSHEPRPRRGIGHAFSRPVGVDSQILQERGIAACAVKPKDSGGHPRTVNAEQLDMGNNQLVSFAARGALKPRYLVRRMLPTPLRSMGMSVGYGDGTYAPARRRPFLGADFAGAAAGWAGIGLRSGMIVSNTTEVLESANIVRRCRI